MRLLYVIDSLAPGGAETSLAEMAPGLVEEGVELHVLPLGTRLDLAPRLEQAGGVVHRRDSRIGRVGNVRAVLDVARQVRPDVVHTTLFEADISGRTAAHLLRIPASSSLVNDSYGASHHAESNSAKLRLAKSLDAHTARFATRFHSISTAVAEGVAPRLGIPKERVEVIPRGRDPERFPFHDAGLRRRTRTELGLPAGAPVILALGRLEPQKGLRHLLAALPAVSAAFPHVVVLVAGREGRASTELRSMAVRLRSDIRFLGHRTDVASVLAAADVFCFPSEREGFGGALIEALAVGCPVVASSIPTSVEVLGLGASCVGLLTPVGDAPAIAEGLIEVLSKPGEAESRAEEGRSRFDELFTVDSVVQQMLGFFDRAAHAERARRE